jgi:hypothetical protein
MKIKHTYLFILFFALTGCTSYQFVTNGKVDGDPIQFKAKAYVVNPELKQEYEILQRSQLYELVQDSLEAVKIKLNPMQTALMCGNPLIGTIFTFGLIPSTVEDQYFYSFTEQQSNNSIERKIMANVRMRLSAYEIFFSGNLKQQIAEGLKLAYSKTNN